MMNGIKTMPIESKLKRIGAAETFELYATFTTGIAGAKRDILTQRGYQVKIIDNGTKGYLSIAVIADAATATFIHSILVA